MNIKQEIEQEKETFLKNRNKKKITSLSFDKDDLLKFCNKLQERAHSAGDIETQNFVRGEESQEEYDNKIEILKEGFILKITIIGGKGEELFGSIEEVFSSVNFPDNVTTFLVNSENTLKAVHNYYPRNSFVVFLDFTKPKVFDLSIVPSSETPNESNFEVQGYDATWVHGLFSEISDFVKDKSSNLSIFHKQSIYDLLLWIFGLPLIFWVCYKASPTIDKISQKSNAFFQNAVYVYLFLVALIIFRIVFHYLRWVCPLVEYKAKGNAVYLHRFALGSILIGLITQYIFVIIEIIL